ncbi:MAG: hypothetical protein ACRCZF_18135, partial [Gemmataceae bacterium]
GNDQVFGFQLLSTWDIYKLIALKAPKGHSWRLNLDYLSDRGTGFGTDYDLSAPSLFGFGNQLSSTLRLYGIRDGGFDNIGQRGPEPEKPDVRYRALWTYQQELFADREPETMLYTGAQVNFQRQFAWSSDKNFLEQYYYQEFAFGQNQETFGFLHASNGPWYGSLLVQGGQDRKWMTETQWLPKADAALIGQSFFDLLLYDARASAGYAQSRPATIPALPVLSTEQRLNTGRFNLTQDLSVPLDVGPLKVAPYGVLDLTHYTEDLKGNSRSRVLGGGGVRSAITLSQIYTGAFSELFNVRGLNHKVTLHGNYYNAASNVPYTDLPLLDRLNDDSIDLGY